jgi:sulfur carrier protein
MIVLQINGKAVQLEGPTALVAYLEGLGVSPRAVAVEHNGVIIERDAYATTTLDEGDCVEIVRMVGGGVLPTHHWGPRAAGAGGWSKRRRGRPVKD